jgi:hypothetical protein
MRRTNIVDDRKNPDPANPAADETAQPDTAPFSQYFGSLKDIVNRYSHCTICGGNLHFTHMTDFSRNLTQEIAKCPECGVRARNVVHRLQ